ncbi:MAG: prepilin-type N-terminal cleavage/methylation domain-containing protein [Acidobacteriota bacterium]|nr:prepilin-type N-terminal cleavage/methylation domain-containing protein [Acidobacteriota bacterium]
MKAQSTRIRERGFTLTEVMVGTAIMIIVFVGVLMLYDRANNVFKTSNEAADMQQNLRVAYDRVLADVRMAGFDYKRGGPLLPGQSAAPWTPTRAYAAGTIVTPTVPNGRTYRAMNAGTSGTSQPSWPGAGGFVTEVGATPPIQWQENGNAAYEQPDEQVEFAGATAITIRGNFDYSAKQTGDVDHGREPALELASPNFSLITTGNDEIVTYALVSNSKPAGTAPNNQSITMFIDINSGGTPTRTARPGGSAERQVTISGVDLTNNNPPYTLYRFTFDGAGAVQRIPLADNIRSLNFFYYADATGQVPLRDAAGTLAPSIGGGGQYNPAVAGSWNAPDRLVRSRIRGIRVRLAGMSPQPDPKFADVSTASGLETGMFSATTSIGEPVFVADTVAPQYRRVVADTMVAPRNLGLTGLPQNFLQPPPVPTITSVCTGYCAIAVLSWNPNTTNPNASYIVVWDTDEDGSFSSAYDAGTSNTFALDLTGQDISQELYFRVKATNQGGTTESPVVGPFLAKNATIPNIATSFQATGNGTIPALPGRVRLSWTAPITNASGVPSCSAGPYTVSNYLREIKGFRIYKSTTPGNNGTLAVDENTSGASAPQTDGYGNFTWDDTVVSCGQNYYYRIETVEYCAALGTYNTSGDADDAVSAVTPATGNNGVLGTAGTSGTPAAPVNLKAAPPAPATPPLGMLATNCSFAMNTCDISLGWSKVTLNTIGETIAIDEYEIERRQFTDAGTEIVGSEVYLPVTNALAQPGSTMLYTDYGVTRHDGTLVNYRYKYRVRAIQDLPCLSGAPGPWVDYPPPCTFTGSIVVQTGASAGDGLTPASAWVMDGGDSLTVVPPTGTVLTLTQMDIIDPAGDPVPPSQPDATDPFTFNWGNQTASTVYAVTFTMTNDAEPPCTEQLVRYVQQEPLPACALTTFADAPSILVNTATEYQLKLDLVNGGAEALTLTGLTFVWTSPDVTNPSGPDYTWNSIKFPSAAGATMTGPGTTSTYNVTLSPKPAQLSTSDVTVNANDGTRTILLNMAKSGGNPPNVTPAAINSICVQYTLPSQVGTTFSCQIKPDADAANPTTCN